jgi:protein-tyrosine phosphatase
MATVINKDSKKLQLINGFINFRDLGGYKTQDGKIIKYNKIYRSGNLAKLSLKNYDYLKKIGIKAICDLRTAQEQKIAPTKLPKNSSIRIIHIPVKTLYYYKFNHIQKAFALFIGKMKKVDIIETFRLMYQDFAVGCKSELLTIFNLLLFPENTPIIIHCTAGKDRTGFVCALLLHALGISQQDVYLDYQKSDIYLQEFKEKTLKRSRFFRLFGVSEDKVSLFYETKREYLDTAYNILVQLYESVDKYIEKEIGVTPYHLKKLRQRFLT